MPQSIINGVAIQYEVLGDHGPWVALTPGGRLGNDDIRSLAGRVAAGGYRVLIHDRRNCGASEVSVAGDGAEHEIWAADLYELMQQFNALPAVIGGGSSGCRMSIEFALRYPEAVNGLLLWRVTGGPFATQRLREKYYGEYIRAANKGGMAAVCETPHFRERIKVRPANKQALLDMDAAQFIAAMTAWDEQFKTGADQPVIGASEEQLRSIKAHACIVPGNDKTHPQRAAAELTRLMPDTELCPLMGEDIDIDVDPHEHWDAKEDALAAILLNGLRRMKQ
jgi:pimeloyl-ACP methyl ester carboxylesterase